MSTHVEGTLVYWHRGLDTTLGVITELLQGGRQLRVRFDSGDEKVFAAQSDAIRRFRFTPGEPVKVLPGNDTGVVVEEKPVGEKLYYTVSLPGNKVKKLAENGLRPAELTDPVERLSNYLRTLAVGYHCRCSLSKEEPQCPRTQTNGSRFPPSGECQTSCGRRSNQSSLNTTHRRTLDALA